MKARAKRRLATVHRFLRSAAGAGKSERDLAREIAKDAYCKAGCEPAAGPLALLNGLRVDWGENPGFVGKGATLTLRRVDLNPNSPRFERNVGIYYALARLLLGDRGWLAEKVILDQLAGELMLPSKVVWDDVRTVDDLATLQPHIDGELLFSIVRDRHGYSHWGNWQPAKVIDLAAYRKAR